MQYIIKPRAARKIYTFYGNVARKYRHTYDREDYKRNVREALNSIYDIEQTPEAQAYDSPMGRVHDG